MHGGQITIGLNFLSRSCASRIGGRKWPVRGQAIRSEMNGVAEQSGAPPVHLAAALEGISEAEVGLDKVVASVPA